MYSDSKVWLEEILEKAGSSYINGRTHKNHLKDKLSQNQVWIYGAGNMGRKVYNYLKSCEVNIGGFLDIKAAGGYILFDKPVVHPGSSMISHHCKNNELIIISILFSQNNLEEIREDLIKWGYKEIIFYYDLGLSSYDLEKSFENITENYSDILATYSLLEDEKSKQLFVKYVWAYACRDKDKFAEPDIDPQYFPNDILLYKGTKRFIDCGAFDGDSIRSLVKYRGKADSVVAFEPAKKTFEKLRDYIIQSSGSIANQITLFPCGVWSKTEMIAFDEEENASSNSVSDNGNKFIQCVSIDEVLIGFRPTFIKMDIEGAEYNALLGAKHTICEFKPDLAICLYHSLEDIWRIPLLLNKWEINYKFYIRSYYEFGHETVLYATCED